MDLRRVFYAIGTLGLTASMHLVAYASTKKSVATQNAALSVIVAHSRATGDASETTIPAFDETKRLSLTDVELDIQLSKAKVR